MSALPASADGVILLEIGSVSAAPGSFGNTIEVDLQNTGSSSITVYGFNFEISAGSDIDFTGAGFSTSASYIFAGDSWDQANSFLLNTGTGSSLSAGDISNSGNGAILGAGGTLGLALVTFHVSPTAALVPVTVSFSTDPSDTYVSDIELEDDSFGTGTIDVAVPEPSTAAMFLAALMGLGVWWLIGATPASASKRAARGGPYSSAGRGSSGRVATVAGPARYTGYRESAAP
jgi:hypothetical protein